MLTLMTAVMLYKQPGSFWEYRMFDLLYPARCSPSPLLQHSPVLSTLFPAP